MRISDWSSDVCSSDLGLYLIQQRLCQAQAGIGQLQGHLLVTHALGKAGLVAIEQRRLGRHLARLLEHLLDEQGLELLRHLALSLTGFLRAGGDALLQALASDEITRR